MNLTSTDLHAITKRTSPDDLEEVFRNINVIRVVGTPNHTSVQKVRSFMCRYECMHAVRGYVEIYLLMPIALSKNFIGVCHYRCWIYGL